MPSGATCCEAAARSFRYSVDQSTIEPSTIMPRKAIAPISKAAPRGSANERVPPSMAFASAMSPARGSSVAASTISAATAKCSGTDVVKFTMLDARNAPAIVPRLKTACRRDITGTAVARSTSTPCAFIATSIVLATTPYTHITMQASIQLGARPSVTSPTASRPPDSRLAPREPSLCSAAAVTGNDRIEPMAADSRTRLTCDVLRPSVALIAGSRDVHVP